MDNKNFLLQLNPGKALSLQPKQISEEQNILLNNGLDFVNYCLTIDLRINTFYAIIVIDFKL